MTVAVDDHRHWVDFRFCVQSSCWSDEVHPGCKLSVADYGALLKNVEMDLMRCLAELLHSATATAIFFLGRSRLKCLPLRKCSGSTEQDVFLAYNMTMCLIVYRWREREREREQWFFTQKRKGLNSSAWMFLFLPLPVKTTKHATVYSGTYQRSWLPFAWTKPVVSVQEISEEPTLKFV